MFAKNNEEDNFDHLDEMMVYFHIQTMGDVIFSTSRYCEDKDVISDTINKCRSEQKKLIALLPKFGIQSLDENGNVTDNYWKWYRWWNNWHLRELSEEDWSSLNRKLSAGLSEEEKALYRPKGSWKN